MLLLRSVGFSRFFLLKKALVVQLFAVFLRLIYKNSIRLFERKKLNRNIMVKYQCPNCGRIVLIENDQNIVKCPFCGKEFSPVYANGYQKGYQQGYNTAKKLWL